MNKKAGISLGAVGMIGMFIAIFFFLPWVSFWLAYLGGWICKIVIGKQLVNGFALLGLTIPIDKIPLFAGVLGWIGGYFKTNYLSKSSSQFS